MGRKNDTLDNFVIFLAKRDGIDKLVKTFQYVSKLSHYGLEKSRPDLAARVKKLEVASGLARKAFRTGRFLTGLNALRTTRYPDWKLRTLAVGGNAGEFVYFFFDHLLFAARIGLINPELAPTMCFMSAFGEGVGYVFFIWSDLIMIRRGMRQEAALKQQLRLLKGLDPMAEPLLSERNGGRGAGSVSDQETNGGAGAVKSVGTGAALKSGTGAGLKLKGGEAESSGVVKEEKGEAEAAELQRLQAALGAVRMDRVMRVMAIAANLSDLFIALADVEPNPFVSHTVTLGISGLVSAWAGWYRNWPAS